MSDYPIKGNPQNLIAQSVTIVSGASVSEMISAQGLALVGVVMPAAWTAAAIGFKACLTGNIADLQTVYDAGGNPEGAVAAAVQGTTIAFPSSDALFFPFLQIVSVTAGTATGVNQDADRTLILLFRRLFS